jgi:hypothetical protein
MFDRFVQHALELNAPPAQKFRSGRMAPIPGGACVITFESKWVRLSIHTQLEAHVPR